ncbi:MFS transporter [Streptomyces carpinensis]|uniref:MFS transporter n=1 Tax=Streptomyces carpinensis TaxID=66369 RepID=UPI00244A1320|nr:MFS transporter [Streptomyces carpinensis]
MTAGPPQSEKAPRARRLVPASAAVLIYTMVMAGRNLTVPLYDLWASKFAFGPVTTTLVFIAYVIGVVGMLLVADSLSDASGRRPVLTPALTLTAVSTLGFALANGLTVLVFSRVLSSAATGLITATATSSIVEIVPGRTTAAVPATAANVGGLSLGVIGAGLRSSSRRRPAPCSGATSAPARRRALPGWQSPRPQGRGLAGGPASAARHVPAARAGPARSPPAACLWPGPRA